MRNRKLKTALILVLVLSLLIGTVAGYLALVYQPEATVSDRTAGGATVPTEDTGAQDPTDGSEPEEQIPADPEVLENAAVLSSNVTIFTEETGEAVNDAILQLEPVADGVQMVIQPGTAFDSLGIGDIFYLEGDEATPFGATYIGKISSAVEGDGSTSYLLESPGIEEVFDQLSFDYDNVMTEENIHKIECVEGVTYSTYNSLSASADSESTVRPLATFEDNLDDSIGFELGIELDILELLNLDKSDDAYEKCEEVSEGQAGTIHVYRTKTGGCYHTDSCHCTAKSKIEITLREAAEAELRPCLRCCPPKIENSKPYSVEFSVTGSVTLEKLQYGFTCDWNILDGDGLKTFSTYAEGTVVAKVNAGVNAELEFGDDKTNLKVLGNCIEFEGLKEHTLPLAYVHLQTAVPLHVVTTDVKDSLQDLTGNLPVSLIAIVYIDLSGSVSVGFEAELTHTVDFYYKDIVVSNYEEYTADDDKTSDLTKSTTFTATLDAKADVEAYLGASLELYVYNLRVATLDLAQAGFEGEGNMALDYTYNLDTKEGTSKFDADWYARFYLKLFQLQCGFKVAADVGAWDFGAAVDIKLGPLVNWTIAEWGKPNDTKFDASTMSFSHVTASDKDAIYYKDLDGTLVREGSIESQIYGDGFFCICGIDESYIYLLKANLLGGYDIVRVTKDGNTSRTIVESISNCLEMDSKYFYVLYTFDDTAIYRIDRSTLESTLFADFDNEVTYLEQMGTTYYAIIDESDWLSIITGYKYRCVLLDPSGAQLADYGTEPEVSELIMRDMGNYYLALRVVSSGYLRNTAENVYWVSKDKSSYVQTDRISGWNYFGAGIITTLDNDTGSSEPYMMVLYNDASGSYTRLATVNHDCAFFTLCQGPQGEWYYFDQTDTQLILYRLSADFSSKKVMNTFSLSDMHCDLTDCAVSILDGRIYFYAMPSDSECTVLYRYNMA